MGTTVQLHIKLKGLNLRVLEVICQELQNAFKDK